MATSAGQFVKTLVAITSRDAPYATPGKPGYAKVSLPSGNAYVAVTDELGGNIMVGASAAGDPVYVSLFEGEWASC